MLAILEEPSAGRFSVRLGQRERGGEGRRGRGGGGGGGGGGERGGGRGGEGER